jgi:hypothetical protein
MKISISQPTFLPYEGYFHLIDNVDKFIFLDNIQFDKRSWQQRNWLLIGKKEKLVSIPVISKNRFNQLISEVEIDYRNFDLKRFFLTIELNYKKTKFFDEFYPIFFEIFNKKHKLLNNLNIELIEKICQFLKIETPLIRSSIYKIDRSLKKENLLIEVIKKNKCDEYISTMGSKNYLGHKNYFENSAIKIRYFEYSNPNFKSNNINCKHLSILDSLFRFGKEFKKNSSKNFKIFD